MGCHQTCQNLVLNGLLHGIPGSLGNKQRHSSAARLTAASGCIGVCVCVWMRVRQHAAQACGRPGAHLRKRPPFTIIPIA